jgi:hypothetical protein
MGLKVTASDKRPNLRLRLRADISRFRGERSKRVFTKRPPAIALAVVSVIAGTVSACGGDSGTSTTGAATSSTRSAEISRLRQRFDDQIRALLTRRGLDPDVIDCALERMSETVTDAQIQEAAQEIKQTGAPPTTLITAATDAGAQCAGG